MAYYLTSAEARAASAITQISTSAETRAASAITQISTSAETRAASAITQISTSAEARAASAITQISTSAEARAASAITQISTSAEARAISAITQFSTSTEAKATSAITQISTSAEVVRWENGRVSRNAAVKSYAYYLKANLHTLKGKKYGFLEWYVELKYLNVFHFKHLLRGEFLLCLWLMGRDSNYGNCCNASPNDGSIKSIKKFTYPNHLSWSYETFISWVIPSLNHSAYTSIHS